MMYELHLFFKFIFNMYYVRGELSTPKGSGGSRGARLGTPLPGRCPPGELNS